MDLRFYDPKAPRDAPVEDVGLSREPLGLARTPANAGQGAAAAVAVPVGGGGSGGVGMPALVMPGKSRFAQVCCAVAAALSVEKKARLLVASIPRDVLTFQGGSGGGDPGGGKSANPFASSGFLSNDAMVQAAAAEERATLEGLAPDCAEWAVAVELLGPGAAPTPFADVVLAALYKVVGCLRHRGIAARLRKAGCCRIYMFDP